MTNDCICSNVPRIWRLAGVTRTVRLTVTKDGSPYDFTGLQTVLRIDRDNSDFHYEPQFTVEGDDNNIIVFAWAADKQPLGDYTIEVTVTDGSGNKDRVNWHGATGVRLVEYSNLVKGEDAAGVESDSELGLDGIFTMNGVGMDAYEEWLADGNEGSLHDYILWMQGPAREAAEAAEAQMAVIQSRADDDHTTAGSDHTRAAADHTTATGDHTRAEEDHTRAISDHTRAAQDHTSAVGDHMTAGQDHLRAEADHTTASTDHTRAESDHSTAASDHTTAASDHTKAGQDSTRAGGDHDIAVADHAQAEADHTRAEGDHTTAAADHTTAAADHTQAASDHTTAAADHTQAVADHAVMAGYDTRLTNVETDVTQLGQEVDGKSTSKTITATSGSGLSTYIPIAIEQGATFTASATGDAIGTQVVLYANTTSTEIGRIDINGSANTFVAPIAITNIYIYRQGTYVTSSGTFTVTIHLEGALDNITHLRERDITPFSVRSNIANIEVLDYANGSYTLKLNYAYENNPFVIFLYDGKYINLNLSTVDTVTIKVNYGIYYDATTGNIVNPQSGSIPTTYIPILTIRQKDNSTFPIFEGMLGRLVVIHEMLTVSNDDITISEQGSSTIVTFNTANTVMVWFNSRNSYSASIAAETSFTISGGKALVITRDGAVETITFGQAITDTDGYYPILTKATGGGVCGPLMEVFVKKLAIASKNIKTAYSDGVYFANPYCTPSYQGNSINGGPLTLKGLYMKFDSVLIIKNGGYTLKSWSELKTDLPNAVYSTSSDYVTDCLLLNIYSYGNQYLYYNFVSGTFGIGRDKESISTDRIILAYITADGGEGILCQQYYNRLSTNQSVFVDEVNKNYLATIRAKEAEILAAKQNFTFAFASDLHFTMTENQGQYVNVTNAVIKNIDHFIGLDAILNGGDSIGYGTKSKVWGLTALAKQFDTIDLDKYIPAAGNHDYNSVADGQTVNTNDWIITDTELETLFFRKMKGITRPSGKLYYYKDFDEKKVRIVVMNTMDVPIEFNQDGEIVYDPVHDHGFRTAQLEWLADTALDLTGKTDGSDWRIVILMHIGAYFPSEGFPGNGETLNNRLAFREICKAFVNRSSYTYSYTDMAYNGLFSTSLSGTMSGRVGKLVAVLSGHGHYDAYVDTDGFNAIQIITSSCYQAHYTSHPFTYDEFALDVIILDDAQEKIILKRFGQGSDREYDYIPQ